MSKNATSKTARTPTDLAMVNLATRCASRGFRMSSLQVHTPDGKTWAIDPAPAGGFRLFEIDLEFRRGPEEHDAADGGTWHLGDLLDYLEAVGSRG